MNSGRSNDYGELDRIRITQGAEKCRAALGEAFRKDARRAAALLNDERLTFPGLYILREQVEGLRIQGYLSPRHTLALRIANQIGGAGSGAGDLSSPRDSVRSALKWIWETGSSEEIAGEDYERILDVAASVLINTYKDREILPPVAELIFRRNRNGRYIHDLVWALFQARDPLALRLIAARVRSLEPKDAELAAKLLNIDKTGVPDGGEGRYAGYLRWLEENEPYLYFTRESYQYAGNPAFCAVDLERKYLQKGGRYFDRQPISASDGDADESLAAFRRLGAREQKALSEYSQKIHGKSVPAWSEWLRAPVGEQLKSAMAGPEGEA